MPAPLLHTHGFSTHLLGQGGYPWLLQVVVGLCILTGIVLWISGRRVLKPAVGFVAAGGGALIGLLAVPSLAPDSGVSPLIGCLGGWIIGLLAGFLLYRPCVAIIFGCALGTGAAVAAAGILSLVAHWPPDNVQRLFTRDTHPVGVEAADAGDLRSSPLPAASLQAVIAPLTEGARDMAAAARDLVRCLEHEARLGWGQASTRDRIIIGAAGCLGLLVGGWLGLTMPAWAASGVTALVGTAIWLPGVVWLAHISGAPGRDALNLPPTGWTIVWVVFSLLGMAAQWAGLLGGGKRGGARGGAKPAPAVA